MVNKVFMLATVTGHFIAAKVFCLATAYVIYAFANMLRDETIATKVIPKCIKNLSELKHVRDIGSAQNID